MVNFFLDGERVPAFVAHLMDRQPVYAPHRKGEKSFAFDKVSDPVDVVLDYPRTMHSVKKFFLPPREELLSFDLGERLRTGGHSRGRVRFPGGPFL